MNALPDCIQERTTTKSLRNTDLAVIRAMLNRAKINYTEAGVMDGTEISIGSFYVVSELRFDADGKLVFIHGYEA